MAYLTYTCPVRVMVHGPVYGLRRTNIGTCVQLDHIGRSSHEANEKSFIVVWLPSVCYWDSSECPLARKGQCRRAPGVVIARDPKKPKLGWEDAVLDHKLACKQS